MADTDMDVCVIGGGVAGSSCALWLHNIEYRVCIMEKTNRLGGLQNESPYPNQWVAGISNMTGLQYAQTIHRQLTSLPMNIEFNCTVNQVSNGQNGFDINVSDGRKLTSRFLVIASGVSPVTGGFSPSDRIIIGTGHGIASRNWKGKRVAILGGGDSAYENYCFIKADGGFPHIFARTIRASHFLQRRVHETSVTIGNYTASEECIVNNQPFDIMIVTYGWQANTPEWFRLLDGQVNDKGFIVTDKNRQSSLKNIYAIGEATQHVHPCVVTSLADGVIAAKAIQSRIETGCHS